MNIKIILLAFLIIPVGCHKVSEPDSDVKEIIIGHWDWIKTIENPRTSEETTPQNSGLTKMLEFADNGIVREYINYHETNSFSYYIELNRSNPKMNSVTYNSITHHFYFSYDTLIFNEAFVDGSISFYKRNMEINLSN